MPSFRSRVLDALDIKKETVKVQVNERFPKTHKTDSDGYALMTNGTIPMVDYAISKQLLSTEIGPSWKANSATKTTLDVLGFVIGNGIVDGGASNYKNSYPVSCENESKTWNPSTTYTGFHELNGIYDDKLKALKHIRKSAIEPLDLDSMSHVASLANLPEHTHRIGQIMSLIKPIC